MEPYISPTNASVFKNLKTSLEAAIATPDLDFNKWFTEKPKATALPDESENSLLHNTDIDFDEVYDDDADDSLGNIYEEIKEKVETGQKTMIGSSADISQLLQNFYTTIKNTELSKDTIDQKVIEKITEEKIIDVYEEVILHVISKNIRERKSQGMILENLRNYHEDIYNYYMNLSANKIQLMFWQTKNAEKPLAYLSEK